MLRGIKKTSSIKYLFSIILFLNFSACGDPGKHSSRLANASSPYLRQHADNPVDWYEWGDETIALAKNTKKPLLISIGYAACHWCHEMEKESFMDTAVARVMNENFVCVKVDREERPDIDNIYMNACQLITGGQGGWPLNAFALPDGKPFFAGTYYSKNGWLSLLKNIAKAYKEKHDLIVKQADGLTKEIAEKDLMFFKESSPSSLITANNYHNLFDSIYLDLDTANGGLKGSPKFPMPAVTEFLLQYFYFTNNKQALDAVRCTLDRMALGGIYDQVGGGFARYSTDNNWHIPHFEKMLYDNGQLISLYAHAYQLTQNEFYKTIVTETISFAEKELLSPEGVFYSSLNADTEEGEGEFYAWTENDFLRAANNDRLIAEYFNITAAGNWTRGRNILSPNHTPDEFARSKNQPAAQFIPQLMAAKDRLIQERNKRKKPAVDTKILTAWNSIMLKAYIDSYGATGNDNYLARGFEIAKFIEKTALGNDGSLKRNYKDGRTSVYGFLDDHAWTAYAFIKLYEASLDIHWLELAKRIASHTIREFYNNHTGLFYYTASSQEGLVVRNIETEDNAIPSSNSVMANVLCTLGTIYDDTTYLNISKSMLASVTGKIKAFPVYHAQWCSLAGLFFNGTHEVVLMGKEALVKNKELRKEYLPDCIVMGATDQENLPLLESKLTENKTLIYVCTNKVCKRPVEDVASALNQIKRKA